VGLPYDQLLQQGVTADIALFAVDNIERLSSCVSRSAVYLSGGFYTAEHTSNGYGLQPAPDLSTERIFASFLQPTSQFPLQVMAY